MENIEQRVKKIIAEQLGVNEAEIKTESSFVDDLGADSLDTVELVMALEEEFEIEIPDEDAEKITTVQQAIDYVEVARQGLSGRPPASTVQRRRVVVTGLGIVSPVGNTRRRGLGQRARRQVRHRPASRASTPRASPARSPAR